MIFFEMEEYVKKIMEKDVKEINKLETECLIGMETIEEESKLDVTRKSVQELKKEEQLLRNHLNILRKENFKLQTSITAWEITLRKKLEEFKQIESQLNEHYNEIWSQRDKFCFKTDEFNNEFGILSEWWKIQMNFVSDPESMKRKSSEEKKSQEIETFQKKIENLKNKTEKLEKQRNPIKVEIYSSADKITTVDRAKENVSMEVTHLEENYATKKVKFEEESIIISQKISSNNNLFSMMDLNKIKLANRRNHFQHRKPLIAKVKKLFTPK